MCELSKKKTLRRLWPMEEETRIGGIPRVRGLDRIVQMVWGSRSSELCFRPRLSDSVLWIATFDRQSSPSSRS